MRARQQRRPAPGRDGGAHGAPGLSMLLCRSFLVLGVVGALGCLMPHDAGAAVSARRPEVPEAPLPPREVAGRDSLLQEIRRYRQIISVLSDSLASDGEKRLSPEHRIIIEKNIGEITHAIEGIGSQLSKLEFQVKDNRISLVDGAGDGIVIAIPDNLDEQVSKGLEALTQAILKELPDSASTGPGRHFNWSSFIPAHRAPAPRRVIKGNVVRVGQDVSVAADEDVRGNVVVVFGDGVVEGRVQGNVVTVGGALVLREGAEVTGTVVAVGGRLAADPGVETGDTVSLDWLDGGSEAGLGRLLGHRVLAFVVSQGLFFLTLVAALLAVAVSPAHRLAAVLARMRAEPGRTFGVGALLGLSAPVALAVLTALLIITVIGVPVALLLALAVSGVVVLALSATGVIVGRQLGLTDRPAPLAVLLGLCALHAVSFMALLLNLLLGPSALVVALVVLGLLVKAAAFAYGLGALVSTRLGSRSASS